MGGEGSGPSTGLGVRFAQMEGRELACRCGRKHCSPSCEACRVRGVARCPMSLLRHDYNRRR